MGIYKKREIVLILLDLRSVENTASIFRTAECLGVKKIYLIGTTPTPIDRFERIRKDFAKVSLGAEKMVSWKYFKTVLPVLKKIKTNDFKIVALEQDKKSKNLKSYKPANKIGLIVGNEVKGIPKSVLKLADDIVEMKMLGQKESLNVSVATGIALFALH